PSLPTRRSSDLERDVKVGTVVKFITVHVQLTDLRDLIAQGFQRCSDLCRLLVAFSECFAIEFPTHNVPKSHGTILVEVELPHLSYPHHHPVCRAPSCQAAKLA